MKTMTRIATAAAFAAVGMGAGASVASAYSFSPASTAFTGTNTGAHVFTAAGAPVSCSGATFTGSSPASGPTASFRAGYTGCTLTLAGVPFAATVTTASNWDITVLTGTGPWNGNVKINAPASGHAVTIAVPSVGCQLYVDAAGNSSLATVQGTNVTPTGVRLNANVSNITFTQNGSCPGIPATGGTTATYTGVVDIAGITINN